MYPTWGNIVVKDNVVFFKTNEVATTRAKWLATLVIDFNEFDHFLSLVDKDIECAQNALYKALAVYVKDNDEFGNFRNLLSWLFGPTTEADLFNIRTQISALGNNQKRIVHLVEHSMTVINELIIGEIKMSVRDGRTNLSRLLSQIDYLALGKVSTRIITPTRLRTLLLQIQNDAPESMGLISDPKTDLWLFYRYLTTTMFSEGEIMIVISIPLIRIVQVNIQYPRVLYETNI